MATDRDQTRASAAHAAGIMGGQGRGAGEVYETGMGLVWLAGIGLAALVLWAFC